MSTTIERLEYGFDRDSRRTWRRRVLASGEDNAYGYDGLSQVVNASLGNLNMNATAIGGVPVEDEAWDYDPTGNWRGYRVEENGAVTLEQERMHDKGNRLMQIEGSAQPVLVDRAGRMTQVPPDAGGDWSDPLELVWDAWSRLVEVRQGGSAVGSYAYDGLNRRTTRTTGGVTLHSYYSDAWRPLEERQDGQTTAAVQYYWGARHRDDLVRRDRATVSGGSLNETRYVLMDYFSPAAITDGSGNVTERYAFSAFGVRRILNPDFSPHTGPSECNWEFGFQGQFLDSESGFYDYGYRYYSPYLGRWTCKDPIEEKGGLNLYAFANNGGVNAVDLLGLDWKTGSPTVTNDLVPGSSYSPFPGAKPQPTSPSCGGTTTMEWNITAKCECKPNQPVWVLTDLSVDFHAHERFLPIPNNYTPEHNAFAQQCEKEHADDFNKWGNTEGSKLVDEVKKNRANISYFGKDKEQQCEDDARKELDAKLKLSASQADRRSITRWDTPKYHTWNDKTNSPARNRPANYPN